MSLLSENLPTIFRTRYVMRNANPIMDNHRIYI